MCHFQVNLRCHSVTARRGTATADGGRAGRLSIPYLTLCIPPHMRGRIREGRGRAIVRRLCRVPGSGRTGIHDGDMMARRILAALTLGALLASPAPKGMAQTPPPATCVLTVQELGGTLVVASPAGRTLAEIRIGDRPHEIAVSRDGGTAYVSQFGITDYDSRIGTPGDRVAEIDLSRARRGADFVLPAPARGPHGVKLRPGTSELFVNAEAGRPAMFVFDTRTRRLLRSFAVPAGTHNFIFSPDGRSLYAFAGANGVSAIHPDDGRILAHLDTQSPIRGLVLTRAGTLLASARGGLLELRTDDLSVVRHLAAPRPGQFIYAEPWPDGMIVAPSPADGGVAIFPADHGTATFALTGKSPILVRRGPDDLIYVSNAEDDHITVLDRAGQIVRTIPGLSGPNGLAFGQCPGPGSGPGRP